MVLYQIRYSIHLDKRHLTELAAGQILEKAVAEACLPTRKSFTSLAPADLLESLEAKLKRE